jgi:hypothetical protein
MSGFPPGGSGPARSPGELLDEALREIAHIERELVEAGDQTTLARFGDKVRGTEVAALFGYTVATTDEARTIDRLTYFPHAPRLIREYLDRQSQGGGLNTQRPPTMVETTSASRSPQGSRSRTTRSAT